MTDRNVSLWIATTPETAYPRLEGSTAVDVAVVGGGITGLTTAYLLAEQGLSVAVVEARQLATGTTGKTTAKVTSLHGLTYTKLASSFGDDSARLYGEANQAAIAEITRIATTNTIDCDLRTIAAYTYAETPEELGDIETEVETAQRLGLPASYTDDVALPYRVRGAVRFDGQALFHPRKYCLGLAAAIAARGGRVFEGSRAQGVEEADGRYEVRTEHGAVSAAHVVIATLLPFHDPGLFYAKTHPSRSYALAARISGSAPDGMFLSAGSPTRSVRPHFSDGETFLVIEGDEHKTGHDPEAQTHYEAIEAWARERFGVEPEYRWSAQDYMPADGVPYVGRMTPASDRLLVATGFKKWGMSNGTAAAMMLRDIVLGQPNAWLPVFDATRLKPSASLGEIVRENVDVAKRFVGDRVASVPAVADLAAGQGAVVDHGGERVAAYRSDAGQLHAVSARCTHMGCLVSFNPAETTWDCPCHGSRFAIDGTVIEGPAVTPLERREIEAGEAAEI